MARGGAKAATGGAVEGPWALPEGWRWVPLGSLGEFWNGAAFKPSDWGDVGTPIIRIQNLNDPSKRMHRTERVVDARLKVKAGDLLVSWSATLDAFVWKREDAWLNQHIFRVVPHEKVVDRKYILFLLKNEIENLKKTEHLHGSTMMHINRGPFLAHLVPLPPMATQKLVAQSISDLLDEVDDGEAALARARGDLGTWRKALLKAAVTGELTADWRAANPPGETGGALLARILAERRARWLAEPRNRGKHYKEPVGPDLESLPVLPDGWTWATTEMLTDGSRGAIVIGPFGSDLKTSDYEQSGVPLIFVRHIRANNFTGQRPTFISSSKADKLSSHVAVSGDALITKMGDPPGDAAVYPPDLPAAVITADCIRWRPSSYMPSSFLCEWINSHSGRNWIALHTKGVAQQKITLELFRMMPVPVPPIQEISKIETELKQVRQVFDQLAETEGSCSLAAATLRQSILAAAFRGELVA